eukprot:3702145-Lingulodinium_polyedra.AAC.1
MAVITEIRAVEVEDGHGMRGRELRELSTGGRNGQSRPTLHIGQTECHICGGCAGIAAVSQG